MLPETSDCMSPSRMGMAAASRITPVSSPCSSRTNSPPSGSLTFRSRPSSCSALEFNHRVCQSRDPRATGMSGATVSSAWRSGSSGTSHALTFHCPPKIHVMDSSAMPRSTNGRSTSSADSRDVQWRMSGSMREREYMAEWMWPSPMPGST